MKKALQWFFSAPNIATVIMVTGYLFIAALPVTLATPPLVAENTKTGPCLAMVVSSTIPASVSGQNPLSGGTSASPSSLPGLTGAQCHAKTEEAFSANSAWSNPAQLCARYHDGKVHKIEALEILTNMGGPWHGHTSGYNLVAGYTVVCAASGPTKVTQLTPGVLPGPY
jgi:hypothetical protein